MKMKMKVYEPVNASISLLLYRILYLFCVTSDTMSLFKYEMKISERDIFSKFLLYYKLISINIVINIRPVRIYDLVDFLQIERMKQQFRNLT